MDDRIGALHLHYRIRGGALAPALTAGVGRAVQAGLAEALSRRMAAVLGDDDAVVVVREIKAAVALDMADCMLDSRVVDCFSRSAANAVLTMLAGDPPADAVMRFEDQTEFVASFIEALIDGSAWERWYYGAFHRYRRADSAATLRAVLEESGAPVPAVFGWLARRGQLAALLALIAPREARRLLGGAAPPAGLPDRADGSAILADAATQLLALLAPQRGDRAGFDQRIAQFLAARPITPDWTSTSSLSVWVMQLLRFVLRLPHDAIPAPTPGARDAIRALLAGPLDWLDTGWLEAQLLGAAPEAQAGPAAMAALRRPLLTPRQQRVLGRLARSLRDGEPHLAGSDDEDDIVVRLIASAAAGMGGDGPLDRSIMAVIEQAVRAFVAAPGGMRAGPASAPLPHAAGGIEALREAGPSALALLDAMLAARGRGAEQGEATAAAGIFLLARAVTDMRLPALARQAGVPLAPLLAALAAKWAGAPLPAAHAMAIWCGAEPAGPAELDAAGAALDALNDALAALLVDRRVLNAATARAVIAADAASLDQQLPCARPTDCRLAATASMVLRGWAHWLPGVAGSTPRFLLDRSVRRAGHVCLSDRRILVELDPAPLDIVLQMAGYFAPIEKLDWLDGRSVVFALRGDASEPAP